MSIRLTLKTAASLSDGSTNLLGKKGKNEAKDEQREPRSQSCPLNAAVFVQRDEFPPNSILGNSEGKKKSRGKYAPAFHFSTELLTYPLF